MRRHVWIAAATTAGLFVLDRVSRTVAFASGPHDLIPGILRSEPVLNTGIAFGLRLPAPVTTIILVALVLLVAGIGYRAYRTADRTVWWASLIVFVGAVSNIIDRFRFGAVRDFLHLSFWTTTGNLGDWMITVGAIILLFSTFRKLHTPP